MDKRRLTFLSQGALLVLILGTLVSNGQPYPARVTDQQPGASATAAAGTFSTSSTNAPAASPTPGNGVAAGSNMVPGDTAVETMFVPPHGSSESSYRVIVESQSPGDVMSAHLIITVTTTGTSCLQSDGTVLYQGLVGDAVFDAPRDGPNGNVPDTLCLRGHLPVTVGNALQGATISLRLAVVTG